MLWWIAFAIGQKRQQPIVMKSRTLFSSQLSKRNILKLAQRITSTENQIEKFNATKIKIFILQTNSNNNSCIDATSHNKYD